MLVSFMCLIAFLTELHFRWDRYGSAFMPDQVTFPVEMGHATYFWSPENYEKKCSIMGGSSVAVMKREGDYVLVQIHQLETQLEPPPHGTHACPDGMTAVIEEDAYWNFVRLVKRHYEHEEAKNRLLGD